MGLRTYNVTLTGVSALLMHWDNIEWSDEMARWKDVPTPTSKPSKAGDDRSPAWRWVGSLYHDGEHVAMPQDNLMTAIRQGGTMIPVPGAKRNKTFKEQSQSGLMIIQQYWPVLVGGKVIPSRPFQALINDESQPFEAHQAIAKKYGFSLFMKRAKIGQSKHVRVRPYFDGWQISGSIAVQDDQITTQALTDILTYAGLYKGLGDWRPSSKTPGPFGRFKAQVELAGTDVM